MTLTTAQNFVDLPNIFSVEELKEKIFLPNSEYLYHIDLKYPTDSHNFWHFVFNSPVHLGLILENFEFHNGALFKNKYLGGEQNSQLISFKLDLIEPVFEQFKTYDLGYFSYEQSLFLYKVSEQVETKNQIFQPDTFIETCYNYWLDKVQNNQNNDYYLIRDFVEPHISQKITSLEFFIQDFNKTCDKLQNVDNTSRMAILFFLALMYKKNKFKRDETHQLINQIIGFDSTIDYLSKNYHVLSKVSLDSKSYIKPEILTGILYAKNKMIHQFILDKIIIDEKEKLNRVIEENLKTKKVSKL